MTRKMLEENPGLEFALSSIFGKQEIPQVKQTNVQHQEVIIEVTRYGEVGEPVTLRLLCAGRHSNQTGWVSLGEGEVVETKGDFHSGEVLPLDLEELDLVAIEAEKEYLR